MFPKLRVDETRYEQLDAALTSVINARGLVLHTPWKQKLIQLYECTQVRHGLVILGPSGAGTSHCSHWLHCGQSFSCAVAHTLQ